MNARERLAALICCASLGVTACQENAPTGQVVASANGEEITVSELLTEAATRDPQNGSDAASRAELLRAVVDRKLWAQAAKSAKLDQQIQFILARRRAEEALLADLQMRALARTVEPPSEEGIERFLRENPMALATRTKFEIDQINVRPGGNALLADQLAKAKSLDEVEAMLAASDIVGQRSRTEWDSMFMPTSFAARLRQLPPNALFLHRSGEMLIAANVVAKTEVPLSAPARRALARQSLTQQAQQAAIAKRLDQLRGAAVIRLQPGYTLPTPPSL